MSVNSPVTYQAFIGVLERSADALNLALHEVTEGGKEVSPEVRRISEMAEAQYRIVVDLLRDVAGS